MLIAFSWQEELRERVSLPQLLFSSEELRPKQSLSSRSVPLITFDLLYRQQSQFDALRATNFHHLEPVYFVCAKRYRF